MKSNLKPGLFFILFTITGLGSFYGFSKPKTTLSNYAIANTTTNVTITIDKNTTDANFEDIKNMLKENGITASFTNIKRNDLNELTGIKIKLTDGNSSSTSGFSSSMPIKQITFGRKDGNLFVIQGDGKDSTRLSMQNMPNMGNIQQMFGFSTDSIANAFGSFSLNDFFNDESGVFSFNGQNIDIDKLREQFEEQFGNGNFQSLFNSDDDNQNQQFQFKDDPNTEKLIIIDGKESNFETLDKLAKANKIEAVDYLKTKTAISVYGEKAKDGAVIVTTK
ncbi:MAG: hypothetical protein ACK5MZ_08520 [Aestuariibaculum sp.]